MRKTPLQVFALAAVLSFVGAVATVASDSSDKAPTKKAAKAPAKSVLEEIAGYKSWARVTKEPLTIDLASVGG
jgi:hypothetical protein